MSSPSTMWRSVQQTPHARTRSSTCPADGSGLGTSRSASLVPGASSTIARIVESCPDARPLLVRAQLADYTRRVSWSIFERIVCGVDASPESLEAVRQSALLLETDGRLLLVAAVDVAQAIHFRVAPTAAHAARRTLEEVEELEREAQGTLERARAEAALASEVATLESGGSPPECLLEAVATEQATLLAVGSHGLGRATGVLLGSVATKVLHRAPCSVLVARPHAEDGWSPRKIVVGVDGSTAAEAALDACRALATRFGSEVTPLTIEGRRPARGLAEAAAGVDLLAVGNRADRRPFGLGSVAEHVAHHARCSVLVVRRATDGA